MSLSQARNNRIRNRLLAALPAEEYKRLQPNLENVSLSFKQIVYDVNVPIEYVYFVNTGVVSLVTIMEDGAVVEVATVGNEGMAGLPVFLGADKIPGQAFSQVPGDAMRMRTDAFNSQVTPDTPLYKLLQRYTQAIFNLIAQSAACNRLHSIEERLCRWLLMTHDRVGADEFPLTQEFMGQMLGVRRASVSTAAAILQKAGYVKYSRGKMTICDLAGMEDSACECYGIIKAEFDRLLGGNSAS